MRTEPMLPRMVYEHAPETFGAWLEDGARLLAEDTALQFRWGDWINYGLKHWPDSDIYDIAAEHTGKSKSTLYDWAWVARNTPARSALRFPNVHYTAYKILAAYPAHIQRAYILRYAQQSWTPQDLEDELALAGHMEREAREQRADLNARQMAEDIDTELSRRGFGDEEREALLNDLIDRWQPARRHVTCPFCRKEFDV